MFYMSKETPDVFRWRDWDWRPLARLAGWTYIAVVLAHAEHVPPPAPIGQILETLIWLSILSFGVLGALMIHAASGTLLLALTLDEAAYGLAERIVRPALGRVPAAATFLAAFAAEVALVLGTAYICCAAHVWPRILDLIIKACR